LLTFVGTVDYGHSPLAISNDTLQSCFRASDDAAGLLLGSTL
jgi:hypothetical protein